MEIDHKDFRVIRRYTLFQVPGILLVAILGATLEHFDFVSRLLWLTALAIWTIKDILLYPFVWRAYVPGELLSEDNLIGMECKAETDLNPSGMIRIYGELWQAILTENSRPEKVTANSKVKIVSKKGMILTVQSISEG